MERVRECTLRVYTIRFTLDCHTICCRIFCIPFNFELKLTRYAFLITRRGNFIWIRLKTQTFPLDPQ